MRAPAPCQTRHKSVRVDSGSHARTVPPRLPWAQPRVQGLDVVSGFGSRSNTDRCKLSAAATLLLPAPASFRTAGSSCSVVYWSS